MAGWMSLIDAHRTARGNASARAEAEFRRALARHAIAGDWISREDDPTAGAVDVGRLFDLVVVAQPDPDAGSRAVPAPRPAEIVLAAGRPVLVIPYAGNFPEIGRRVMVAWNGSREATRALHDAMFVLDRADQVTVVAVDPVPADRAPSAADVAELLVRRGIGAQAETPASGDVAVADVLVSRAADLAADLVVMGAYGHSRLREYVLGGVSRSVLGQMTLPVLLAH
jgi:nucleotide-binding universal stress UspA family protein